MKNLVSSNFCLKNYNTFNVSVKAKLFFEFNDEKSVIELIKNKKFQNEKKLVLGGGSNLLFSKDFDGLILKNNILGIKKISETKESIDIEVGAGENWHDFVIWSVENNLSGIENLALIPGLVGASPIQNIGAYGVEVKDSIIGVRFVEVSTGNIITYTNKQCKFEYRNSIFKKDLKNKTIITKIIFRLSKTDLNITKYGAIKSELELLKKEPSNKNICDAVINIRSRKLPDPKKLGNSGSFFKNPIISNEKYLLLKNKFPEVIAFKESEKEMKIAAGWLIEKAGWKGFKKNNVGVYKNQALVIVNYGGAKGKDIIEFSKKIQNSILEKFQIKISPEVNII